MSFKVNGQVIEYANLVKHLGNQLATETPCLVNGNNITAAFNKAVNLFLANFGHLSSLMLVNLFHQYCCSFYGITLLDLHSLDVTLIHVARRKAVRRVLRLPYRTHNNIVNSLCNGLPFIYSLYKHIFKLYYCLKSSDNCEVKCVIKRLPMLSSNLAGKKCTKIRHFPYLSLFKHVYLNSVEVKFQVLIAQYGLILFRSFMFHVDLVDNK